MSTPIVIACFLRGSFSNVELLARRLNEDIRYTSLIVKGFNHSEFVGLVRPLTLPKDFAEVDLLGYHDSIGDDASRLQNFFGRLIQQSDHHDRNFEDPALLEWLIKRFLASPEIPACVEQYAIYLRCFEHFLDDVRPPVVILPEEADWIRGGLVSALCRERGIKTLIVSPRYNSCLAPEVLIAPPRGDHFFTFSTEMREMLSSSGVPSDKIHLVSWPYDTTIIKQPASTHDRPFLYAHQHVRWESEILRDLSTLVGIHPELRVIVPIHPEIRHRVTDEYARAFPNLLFDFERSADDLLPHCRGVIGQASTVLLKAAYRGLPIVFVNYSGLPPELLLPAEVFEYVSACNKKQLEKHVLDIVLGARGKYELATRCIRAIFPGEETLEDSVIRILDMIVHNSGGGADGSADLA